MRGRCSLVSGLHQAALDKQQTTRELICSLLGRHLSHVTVPQIRGPWGSIMNVLLPVEFLFVLYSYRPQLPAVYNTISKINIIMLWRKFLFDIQTQGIFGKIKQIIFQDFYSP